MHINLTLVVQEASVEVAAHHSRCVCHKCHALRVLTVALHEELKEFHGSPYDEACVGPSND